MRAAARAACLNSTAEIIKTSKVWTSVGKNSEVNILSPLPQNMSVPFKFYVRKEMVVLEFGLRIYKYIIRDISEAKLFYLNQECMIFVACIVCAQY